MRPSGSRSTATVFDYGYDEVAGIVGKTQDNCRQLATRARRHVHEARPRADASRGRDEQLARRSSTR